MTKVIGLTGSIGSGKSTVARLMEKMGACVFDTDEIAHELYRPGKQVWNDIIHSFGRQILGADGRIDRRLLGDIVFRDAAALKRLNSIIHPVVLARVKEIIEVCRSRDEAVALLEVPLLIEAGWTDIVDEVWVVVASREKVLERLKKQRGFDEDEFDARLHSRLPDVSLKKYADVVIVNDGSRTNLKKQIEIQWQRLNAAK